MRKYIYYEEIVNKDTLKVVSRNSGFDETSLDLDSYLKDLKNVYSGADSDNPEYSHILVAVYEVIDTKQVYLDPYLKKLKDIDIQLSNMINENNLSLVMLRHLRSELYSISNYQLTSYGVKLKKELLENIKLSIKECK